MKVKDIAENYKNEKTYFLISAVIYAISIFSGALFIKHVVTKESAGIYFFIFLVSLTGSAVLFNLKAKEYTAQIIAKEIPVLSSEKKIKFIKILITPIAIVWALILTLIFGAVISPGNKDNEELLTAETSVAVIQETTIATTKITTSTTMITTRITTTSAAETTQTEETDNIREEESETEYIEKQPEESEEEYIETEQEETKQAGREYLINYNSGKYHKPSCYTMNDATNCGTYYGTAEELEAQGYVACKKCHPY